jgi:hypothetical protein
MSGNDTISAPVIMNNDVNINGAGTLNLSGGISGPHDLNVLGGTITAKSIQGNTLNISPGAKVKIQLASTSMEWKGGNSPSATNWDLAANWNPNTGVPDGLWVNLTFGTQAFANNVVDMITRGRTVSNINFLATTSTTIQSSGGYNLTLDNDGLASTITMAGSHTISSPVIMNNDVNISGTGTLNLSGGISGSHDLNVLSGNLTVKSIHVNSLIISPGAKVTIQPAPGMPLSGTIMPIPEPSTLVLIGVGAFSLLVYGWRRR